MRKLSTPQLIAGKEVKLWPFRAALVLFMVMLTSLAFSQINYTRTTFTSAYTPITVGGGATLISTGTTLGTFSTTGGVASGTEGAAHLPMPFNFNYNGTLFTGGVDFVGICTNGYIYPVLAATGATNAGKIISAVNTNLFTITTPNNTIAPYWDDLTIGTAINGNTGSVLVQTTGTAGSQVMTIQFTDVPAFSSVGAAPSSGPKALNFQVKLYEGTNVIEFVYGPVVNGTTGNTYNLSESASIGIEGSAGGNNNYIDAVTGSKTANFSMMSSNKYPSLLNFRFTPGAPTAVAAGTYSVGVGQTYPSLSEAVADLNHRGISGAVSLDLVDAVYDSTVAGGKNIFPIVMSNITGTSVANTITVSRTGSHADLRYRGSDAGNLGNQTSGTLVTTTFEPMLCLFGTDWVTFNNVDFTYNGVQGTAVSYNAAGKVDNSIGVMNSSAIDGATNNTFQNFVCTNDRTGTGGGQAIRHFTQTAATNATGANSNNTYRDFVIKNGTSGFLISGTAGFPDINNRIITSSCNTYNIIGDESVANDMQNPGLSTSPFGITMTNQSGFTVSNNKISNMTNMNTVSNIVDGINVSLFQGTCVVSNNIIKNLRQNLGTGTSVVTGIKMTNATTGVHEIRVYNNSISNLTTAYAGAASTTRMIRGMSGLSTANNTATYAIYNNSVSIDGSASPNASNNCFDIAGTLTTQPKYDVRNNIFANYTIAQGATAKHCCYFANSATLLGGTGTTVNQNDMWLANDGGVSGFIGQSSTIAGTFPVGTFNTTYATYVTAPNISADPGFFNIYSNLHATNNAALAGTGSAIPVYITTDLDCATRTAPQHIGAYLVNACPSGIPTVTVSPAGPSCTLTLLTATTSAASPQYQWMLNGVDIFGATSSTYTPGVTGNGTYTCRVNNLGESCFGISNAVVVNLSPTISVSPALASVCDGQSVNITTTVTNNPALTYTVTSIPFGGAFAGALTNGASLPGGPGLIVGALGDEGNYNAPQNSIGAATDLPWNFNFYGRNYTKFTIHSNGQLLMGTGQTTANSVFTPPAIPALANPNNWLGFWADLSVNAADQIRWDVVGSSPSRKFIVRYTNVDFFSATPFVTFQYELNETTHDIDFYLTSVNGITNTKAIGIEDTIVGGVVQGLAATGRNSGTWTATNEGWKFAQVPPPSYDYAWTPAAGLSSTSVSNPVCTPALLTNTVYTVTVTNVSTGCSVTATTNIINLGVADAAPTTLNDTVCANEAAHLEAAGASTLNWYTAPSGGSLVHTGTTWDSTWTATTSYYVESFNGNCPSPRTIVTVVVNPIPATTPSATPSTICFGSTSQLDAGTFLSGLLASPTTGTTNGSSATGFDITNLTASPITLHYFTFQSSSVAGTVGVQQIWMNTTPMNCVFPANVTTAPGWVQIANVSTTSAGNVGFPTTITYTTIPFDVNITIPAGQTYAFAVGGALGQSYFNGTSGCPIMGSTPHLTVKEGFGGTLTGTIAARRWIGTVSYQYGDPNLGFAWSPAGDLNSATIKSPIATPSNVGANPYTVTVTNAAGCTNSATVTVTTIALPPAPSFTVNSVPCGNGAANVSATGTGGTIKWWTAASGGTQIGSNSPLSINVVSDTTIYVSETTLASPFCEGPRTAVFIDITEPDTIAASVDIPLICDQAPGAVQVVLTVANVSVPQNNQFQYTWTAPISGGLNSSTGTSVTANPTASTTYTVTANQIGGLTVNINGVSGLDTMTTQDSIAWTLKDASNVIILSSPVYSGINNNVTTGPVYSNNGPFTFQIYTSPTDTGFANFYIMCDGDTIGSGCIKGAADTQQVTCLNTDTVTVTGLNSCLGSCTRIKTVFVGVGITPTFSSLTATQTTICEGSSTTITAAASSTGGAPGAEFGTYCAPVIFTSPGATSDNITNVTFNTLNNNTGDGPGDYNYYAPGPGTTTTVNAGFSYTLSVSVNAAFSQAKAVFIDWNNNGSFADVGEMVLTGASSTAPASGSVLVPVTAANAQVRMRVVCVFGGTPAATYACSPNTFGFGEVEDYTITVVGGTPSIYTWSPATGLNQTTGASVIATPTTLGPNVYTVTAFDPGSGCSSTSSITITLNDVPPAPTATGDTVCGPDTVTVSATLYDLANTFVWTDTIGGQILGTGTSYSEYVTQSGSFYVHEVPPTTSTTLNNNIGASAGFFPDGASFMNFTVLAPGGIIINTVDVSTNAPVSNVPLVIALTTATGQIVNVLDTIILTAGGNTALQTIPLNLYVPQGTWRLQPILNPNLNVSNTSTLPATLAGQITVSCFGNVSNSCFPVNFNGLFYNWNVSTACISPATVVNYVVNPSPAIGIASSNGTTFCDSINTVLTGVDSTLSGYDVFEWSPATGLSASTGQSVTVSNLYASTTYTLTAHNTVSGCNAIATISLTVNPSPSLSLSYHDTTYCPVAVPNLPLNSTAAKSSVVPVGNRFDPNFVVGTLYGGNTTQYSQMIFTAAELNAAGLVGPTNITSIAYYVSNKLTTTTYTVDIKMRSDVVVPSFFSSTAHINTGLTTVYNNPAIASTLGWNTYVFSTPFFWDGVSNVLVSQCFTHNIPGFFDINPTSPTGAVRYNALNASACAAATGAFIPVPNQNDRPNVRFTGGNVLFSWSPALGLSGTTIEDPVVNAAAIGNNDTSITYTLTVTDPLSGCSKTDSVTVNLSTTPLPPVVHFISDSVFCTSGNASMYVNGTTGDFQWQKSSDGINYADIPGATNDTLTETITSTTYYKVDVSCTGDSVESISLTFIVNNPQVVSVENDTICGVGQICLSAVKNDSSYFLQWFADSSGGNVVFTGDTFCTVIAATDTFWVQATVDTNSLSASGNIFYLRASTGEPWGSATNVTALNAVYGPQGTAWNLVTYPTAIPASIFSSSTKIVFMEGSDANVTEFNNFYTANLALIQNWVSGGGHLFVNVAPNGGPASIPLGFGGVLLTNSQFTPTATIAAGQSGHPIFNGPIAGVGTTWTGGSYGHAVINLSPATKLIDGIGGNSVLSVLDYGNGRVLFGGMTMTNFHSPLPAADNLRRNMFSFLNTGFSACNSARVPVIGVSTPPPPMAVTPNTGTICELTCINLDVDSAGQANYDSFEWYPATGLSATTGASVVACPTVNTSYTVYAFNSTSGCGNSDTVVLTVVGAPLITSLSASPDPVCSGDSAQISIAVTPFIPPSGNYSVSSIPFAPVTPTGTPVVLQNAGTLVTPLTSGSADDGTWQNIPLPAGFAFNYYGATPTAMSISTNGFLTFTANSGVSGCCSGQLLPNATTPNDVIAYGWEDWNQTAGTTDYFTEGVAPFRKFVIRSQNIPRFGGTGAPSTVMVVLNETLNTIEVHITSIVCGASDVTTLGIENATGTLGTVVAGRNAVSGWTATNEGWLFSPPVPSGLSYSWAPAAGLSSTSVSNPKVAPSATTTYTVTVFESGTGCSRTDSLVVNVTPLPQPVLNVGDTILCSNDPGFDLIVTDNGAYSGGYPPGTQFDFYGTGAVLYQTGTSNIFYVATSDNYYVEVTLPGYLGGCSAISDSANIDFGTTQAPQYLLTSDSVVCYGDATGNAIAQITFGGTPDFRYMWYDSNNVLVRDVTTSLLYDSLIGVPAGMYTVVIIDHQGVPVPPYCSVTDSIFVGEPIAPLYVEENLAGHVDVQCYGYSTGALDITVSGGTGAYTYDWSNGSTDEDLSNIVAGIYTCTVTDERGCSYVIAIEIVENPQVTIGTAQSNVSCHAGFDGTATVYVNGGVPGYTYLWSDGQTTETAFNLAAGIYTVTITDNSGIPGCDTTMTFLISEPPLLDATGTVIDLNCYGSSNGVATANPFGGTPPYTYSWNSIPVQTTQTATGLPAGQIVCTITDSVGCTKDLVLQVAQPDSLFFDVIVDNVTCNGGNDGSITISVEGGTPGYSYLWSNGGTTEVISGITAGTYVVTVTDANGCQVIQNILVTEPAAINIAVSQTNPNCNGGLGSALATVTGGNPPYTYSWNSNPAQTTNTATGLPAGTYTVVVTDASGCTASQDVIIVQPDPLALNPNVTEPLCNGGLGSIELYTSGGTAPYTYIWSNGNSTDVNAGITAGTYTVTVTDANGCVLTQTFVLNQPSAIVVNSTVTNVSCNGNVNGSIVLSVSGGVGPYSYQWSNGSTDASISGLAAGNYTVTVTDANSCQVTVTIAVTQPAVLTCACSSNITNVSCFGGSNGSITAMPLGGTPPYSYSWIRIAPTPSGVLATTQTISGLTAGTYQVTITDANGCVVVDVATVNQPAQLIVTPTVNNNACNGGNNGTVALTVTGGVPPYTYAWNTVPAQTTAIATGLAVGSYTAIVTDANGCSQTVTVTITQPPVLTVTTSKTNVSCNGGKNGTASVTATGGVNPYTYLWSNGKTNKNITGLGAGVYTVTVTDANGCTKTASVTITQPTKITALYVVTNPTCYGSTNGAIDITVTGGTPPYTYAWSTGATTQDISGIGAGAYSVYITDNKGCVILANIILTQPNALALSTTKTNVKCFGASTGKLTVQTTGGTSPYSYLWSNGATTATANNLAAGTYTVTVTDSKGCSASISGTINQPAALVCSPNVACMQNVTCFGGSDGKLCVSVSGGNNPYTYLWNTNPVATTAAVNNVPAGTYTVIVTDKNGCTTSCTFTITQPATPVSAVVTGTNVNCFGGSNGTATVVASGGTGPYTYLWNTGTAATTDVVTDLTAGVYTVIVTDANGCTGTGSITITQNTQVTLTATSTNIACNGNGTGTITAVAAGGLAPYTYTLNPGAISNNTGLFTGLAAGTYDVTVTDEAGCTASVTGIIIIEPTALTMDSPTATDVSCFGGNNGTATAGAVSGGTPPYTYIWNTIPPQGTVTATGLTAGTYIVMVTDAYGCTAIGTAVVNEPASPLAVGIINQVNNSCNGGTLGSAEASASGGTPPYSYLWSNGETTAIVSNLAAGTYVVTVTDANGCQALTSVVITEAGQFSLSAVSTDVLCNGGNDGTITATVTGGNAPFIYTLNPGAISNGTGVFTNLPAGNYTVDVVDNGGCTATATAQINEPSILIANTTSTNVSCNGGSNGTATVYATGGTAPYTYAWSNGASIQNPTGFAAGTYTVTVTDANGCTVERTVTISEPAALTLAQSQVDVTCNGGANGSATATVTGGTLPYFYFWSNGQMSQTASGLTAGTYTVTVTDYKGCTISATYVIVEGAAFNTTVTQGTIQCYGGTTLVSVAVTGGNAPYTYSWSHDALNTTDNATVGAGTYFFTVTDASGCSETVSITVTQPSQVLCGASSTNVTCNGLNNGTASVTPSGGTAPYTYLWTGGSTDASITGLTPGVYAVVVTDANGCSTTCQITITEPAVLSLSMSNSNASCGTQNGSAMAIVSGGTAPYTYLWDDGQTTSSISNLSAGTYTVTVNDANNCGPLSATITIGDTPPVSCTVEGVNPTCAGYNNGSATVTVTGGAGSNTYSWNTAPIQTTVTATGLAAGTYEVTVTDISGCSSTCTVEITEPAPLVLTGTTNTSACGGTSGSAVVNAFGGTPYSGNIYIYLWSDGQTTQTATGLSTGTYYVTVTDSLGCSEVLCLILQQGPGMSCNTSTTPSACGQAIGSATVNVFGGQGPYSYSWNTVPQQTNAIATLLAAGTYTVVVTDAYGCTTSCTATVVEPGGISYILNVVNAACNGGNGSVTVALLNGGTGPYTYSWSNGSTTASTGPVTAGSYTVTVTDANGCSNVQTGTATEPAALVVATTQTNVTCNGNANGSACANATGGTQPYLYVWNTGSNSQCISGLAGGTYTVTATDANGCTSSAQVVIIEPAVLDTLNTITTAASCGLNNGTACLVMTGGTPPYSYSWSTSPVQTTDCATGLAPGNNFVTITDANGCAITICVKVPTSAGIGLNLSSPVYAGGFNIRCNGGSDGSVNLTVSGTGPFTYNWSNGATTEDIIGLSAGTYTVIVSNGGCTSVGSITLTQAPALSLTTSQLNVTCNGGTNGSATANPTGGVAPYSYSWNSSPVKTTQTATGLPAGNYIVTVSDANGCTQTAAVTITQPASGLAITATSVNPSCNGYSDGSIDVTVSGGTPPYSYIWTNGAITEDISGVPAGSHTITVTDANGCTISLCVVLTQPTQIALTVSKTDVSCAGGSTGSASVVAAGGTPGYTYLWNTGATTASINNLVAGTYTVTVTDSKGCIRNATVVINAAAPMVLSLSSTNVTVYGGNNGTASVLVVSGGTPAYSYSWNTVPVKTTSSVTGLTAGTYQVTVTDSKGCVKTGTVVITQPNYNCSSGTPFRTETPSRWGSSSGTAATYLNANFSAAFPAGLVVGGGCGTGKTLTLTSANAVRSYEVNQSTSGSGTVLSANLTNPTSVTFPSALAANTVALKLNVTFDAYDPNFAPIPTVPLGNLIYNAAPFSGLTVNQILNEANKKLGGCSSPYTVSQLNTALQNIDSAYKAGVTGPTATFLVCPAAHMSFSSNTTIADNGIVAYPNPSAGIMNLKFTAQEDGKVVINVVDVTGRLVWNIEENVFSGENIRTYDFNELRKGVYFMQVTKDGKTDLVRIVLQ